MEICLCFNYKLYYDNQENVDELKVIEDLATSINSFYNLSKYWLFVSNYRFSENNYTNVKNSFKLKEDINVKLIYVEDDVNMKNYVGNGHNFEYTMFIDCGDYLIENGCCLKDSLINLTKDIYYLKTSDVTNQIFVPCLMKNKCFKFEGNLFSSIIPINKSFYIEEFVNGNYHIYSKLYSDNSSHQSLNNVNNLKIELKNLDTSSNYKKKCLVHIAQNYFYVNDKINSFIHFMKRLLLSNGIFDDSKIKYVDDIASSMLNDNDSLKKFPLNFKILKVITDAINLEHVNDEFNINSRESHIQSEEKEEIFFSYFQIGNLFRDDGWNLSKIFYEKSFMHDNSRADGLFKFMENCRNTKQWYLGQKYSVIAPKIPKPITKLHINQLYYDYKLRDESSIISFHTGNFELSHIYASSIFKGNKFPESQRQRLMANYHFTNSRLPKMPEKKILIYLKDEHINIDICVNFKSVHVKLINDLIETMEELYEFTVVSNVHNMSLFNNKYSNHRVTIFKEDDFQEYIKSGVIYDHIFLYNDVSLLNNTLYKRILNGSKIYLFQFSKYLVNVYNDNLTAKIVDLEFAENIFSKLNKVIFFNSDTLKKVEDKLKLEKNKCYLMNIIEGNYQFIHEFYEFMFGEDNVENDLKLNNKRVDISIKHDNCLMEKTGKLYKFDNNSRVYSLINNKLNYYTKNMIASMGLNIGSDYLYSIYLDFLKTNGLIDLSIDGKIDHLKYKKSVNSGITFTITTCKRYNLFEKTMRNLILKCKDFDIIDKFICIDDNSSPEDRLKMRNNFPFFFYYMKNEKEKGHPKSMNILWDLIETDRIMHFEDDWIIDQIFSIEDINDYLKENEDKLGQIALKKIGNSGKQNPEITKLNGKSVYQYIYNVNHGSKKHPSLFVNSEYDKTVDYGGKNNYDSNLWWWWPGFTLNPGLINLKMLKNNVGYFKLDVALEIFEYDYGVRCFMKDILIYFMLYDVSHIGTQVSGYKLNNTPRFYD